MRGWLPANRNLLRTSSKRRRGVLTKIKRWILFYSCTKRIGDRLIFTISTKVFPKYICVEIENRILSRTQERVLLVKNIWHLRIMRRLRSMTRDLTWRTRKIRLILMMSSIRSTSIDVFRKKLIKYNSSWAIIFQKNSFWVGRRYSEMRLICQNAEKHQ